MTNIHEIWANINYIPNPSDELGILLAHAHWEFYISEDNSDQVFEWVINNISNKFTLVFCDYYYILVLFTELDATLFKLVWTDVS